MKASVESGWNENFEKTLNIKRHKLSEHELDELREHVELISFNIEKVYRHAKDRSRKEYNKTKFNFRKSNH